MRIHRTKAWPTHVAEARAIQESLRRKVIVGDQFKIIRTVAGVDVGFEKHGTITRAAVMMLDFPGLISFEQAIARQSTRFPYAPGYLSFREAPATMAALRRVTVCRKPHATHIDWLPPTDSYAAVF